MNCSTTQERTPTIRKSLGTENKGVEQREGPAFLHLEQINDTNRTNKDLCSTVNNTNPFLRIHRKGALRNEPFEHNAKEFQIEQDKKTGHTGAQAT